MTKYREIVRLSSLGFSNRNIALSVPCSRNTVAKVLKRAQELDISWPLDLLSGQKIDLDMMQYYPIICKEEAAIEKICELIENLPEVGMIEKVPERILTELLLRELDPGKSLFSEEEKSLIREYGSQMKDERKTREIAEKLCSRDRIGNQNAALVIQEARDKIEEKRLTPNTTPYIL